MSIYIFISFIFKQTSETERGFHRFINVCLHLPHHVTFNCHIYVPHPLVKYVENITRKQTHTNIKGKGYDNSQGSHKILIFMYIYLLFTYFKDVKRLPLSLFYLFIRLYTYYHPLNNFFLSSEKWSRVKKVMIMSFIIINKRKI